MNYLIVVDSCLNSSTAEFWDYHQEEIKNRLVSNEVYIPKLKNYKLPAHADEFDAFILIGNDRFFNGFVNTIAYNISEKNRRKFLAFLPDKRNSAIASSLRLPSSLEDLLDLIVRKQTILLDLMRCHYIDKKGIPDSRLVLNDVLIGISPARLPLAFKTVIELAKNLPLLSPKGSSKEIQIIENGATLYKGKYAFSLVLLGNRISQGPKIPYRTKIRCNLGGFDYYQLNSRTFSSIRSLIPWASSRFTNQKIRYLFSGTYRDLIVKGEGQENTIIADGIHLGRLPATFSFLPRALRVIAPILTIKASQPVTGKVTTGGIPKPIRSRNALKND
jgi:diacylglycerol kinase family enzyme